MLSFIPVIMLLISIMMFALSANAAEYKTTTLSAHSIPANSTTLYQPGGRNYFPARPSGYTGGSYSVTMNYSVSSPYAIGHQSYSSGSRTQSGIGTSTVGKAGYYPSPTFHDRIYCTNGWQARTMYVTSGSISATIW